MLTFENAPDLLTPQQVQELLQISRITFYRRVKKDKIPGAFKFGNSWRVDRDDLKAWIDAKKQK